MQHERIMIQEDDIATIHITDGVATKELRKNTQGDGYVEYYSYNDIDENSIEMYCDICGTRYEPQPDDTLCPNGCTESSRTVHPYQDISQMIYSHIDEGLLVTITLKNGDAYDFQLQDIE